MSNSSGKDSRNGKDGSQRYTRGKDTIGKAKDAMVFEGMKDLRGMGADLKMTEDRGAWRHLVAEPINQLGFQYPQQHRHSTMFTVNQCCCCVSLRIGCLIIGVFELVPWIMLIVFDITEARFLKPEPNEDEENKNQRHAITLIYILHLFRCTAYLFFGVSIILVSIFKKAAFLKVFAVFEVILFVFNLFILLVFPQHAIVGRFYPCWVTLSIWRLHSAVVLYSYAIQLETNDGGYIVPHERDTTE